METIASNILTVKTDPIGAELTSIKSNETGTEYLWQGDPAFWKRHSPILFPIVGSLWNGCYKDNDGKVYKMSQHGFARDLNFDLLDAKDSEVYYRLSSNVETLEVYPFHFELTIGYRLLGNKLEVLWQVRNNGFTPMPFQIGAHPAFNYPGFDAQNEERGYFAFDKTNDLEYILIEEKGCVDPHKIHPLLVDNDGLFPIDIHTFDKDALILENGQVHKVALLDKRKKPYITLHFEAPVVGLWSPPAKNAPFVCIEPWYGRCDSVHYSGTFQDREWVRLLEAGDVFNSSYIIEVGE